MGSGASVHEYVETSIRSQFEDAIRRRERSDRDESIASRTINLNELLNHVRVSGNVLPVDFCNVGVLYVMDSNLDGRFSAEEVTSFLKELSACKRSNAFPDEDFQDP